MRTVSIGQIFPFPDGAIIPEWQEVQTLAEARGKGMDMSGGQREDSRYDEYTAILAENPVYRHAFEGACEEYLRRNGKQMPLDSRLYLMVFAPSLIGFVNWVMEQAAAAGKDRLYFLSRDGYQMYLIGRQLSAYRNLPVDCRYLHVSRYSMRIPGYHLNMEKCIDSICVGGIDVTPLKILRRGALTEEECRLVIKELHLEAIQNKVLNFRQVTGLKERLAVSGSLKKYIRKHSLAAYDKAIGYLKQEGLCKDSRYAIADSGWVGTLQCSIEGLVQSINSGIEVEGYYFGMYELPEGAKRERFHPYYFSAVHGTARKARFSNSLFETIVSAEEGMTLAYGEENGKYVPIVLERGNPNAGQLRRNAEALELFLHQLGTECGSSCGQDGKRENGFGKKTEDNGVEFAERLLGKFMSEPTALEYDCYGKDFFSDDVFDDCQREAAAKLTWEQIKDQRLLSKLLTISGMKKAVIHESAWLEGSAFGAAYRQDAFGASDPERRLRAEWRHIRRYKSFIYLRKQLKAFRRLLMAK